MNYLFFHTPIFYLIQSVWRDEAFSYFMAKPPILEVIKNTANDFNPPLYYLLLHFWMQIVGHWDEGLRILSFLPHVGTVYIAYLLYSKITGRRFAFFAALFTFFNPMLLYYAFEMRMYSYYAFFALASFYFIYQKRWGWYLVSSILGLYTHSFFPLIIASYLSCLWLTKQNSRKNVVNLLKPLLFYLPWLPIIINQFVHSQNSWIYPVDKQLVISVLGNLFVNYEGTPGFLWPWTALLSIIIMAFLLMALINKNSKKYALWTSLTVFLPLLLILGYSIVKRPIYVNRYLIFITVFEVIGITSGIWSIKNKIVRATAASLWLTLVILINLVGVPYRQKTDFKSTFAEINQVSKTNDYVYAKTPIGFLESVYYYRYPTRVFVYNPDNITIPYYIGISVVFPNASKPTFPPAPSKTYLVGDDASYEIYINQ